MRYVAKMSGFAAEKLSVRHLLTSLVSKRLAEHDIDDFNENYIVVLVLLFDFHLFITTE